MKRRKSNFHCSECNRDYELAAGIAIHNKQFNSQTTVKDSRNENCWRKLSTQATQKKPQEQLHRREIDFQHKDLSQMYKNLIGG